MRKLLPGFLVVALSALLFVSFTRQGNAPAPRSNAELAAKSAILNRDLAITDALCRSQCRMDLRQGAAQFARKGSAVSAEGLNHLRKLHPKMKLLFWSTKGKSLDQAVQSGRLSSPHLKQALRYLKAAKNYAEYGGSYASPPMKMNGEHYVVLGVPAAGGHALIGVVYQHLLRLVAEHQSKNLRLEAFPRNESKHYKLETVDPETLTPKKIVHPEENGDASHYHQQQIVVKFKQAPTEAQLARIKTDIRASGVRKLGYTYVFESTHRSTKNLMAYFQKWDVAYAEPHYYYATNQAPPGNTESNKKIIPNDTLYARYQWNLPEVSTNTGWSVSKGSSGVKVAIVDTGVDLNHPDLKGRLLPGINLISPKSKPMDDVGHGTHVAGVIAALVDNYKGVAGMTWYNPILPIKALDSSGAGSTYSVAQGIIWAADHGAKVINMSLGNYTASQFLHDAIRYAYNKDVVLIAASGNDNTSKPGYPAAYPEVLAVSATDSRNHRAPFSNYGSYIDVMAPGVNIASTFPDNQYAALSGTSMACPHVTALAALIRSANPGLTNKEVMDIMRKTARDLGPPGKDARFGYGLINVNKALQSAGAMNYSLWFWPKHALQDITKSK